MRNTFLLGIASCIVFAIAATGCRSGGWLPPAGPLNAQKANAIIHDPYPLDDIGPDDNSVRPPDYQRSLPEPVRNRIGADAMPWLGR